MAELSEARKEVIRQGINSFVHFLETDLTEEVKPLMTELDSLLALYNDPSKLNWLGMLKRPDRKRLKLLNKKFKQIYVEIDTRLEQTQKEFKRNLENIP